MKIAFCGKMGAGKDASVEYLIKTYGGTKIAFSDPIYDIMHYTQKICGFNIEKDRKFLQWIGTEWGRETDPDIWINLAIKNAPTIGNIYCSDCRFINELEALKKDKWICIKLINNHRRDSKRVGSGDINHISESQIDLISDDKWDYIVLNDSSLTNLYDKIDKIVVNNFGYKKI